MNANAYNCCVAVRRPPTFDRLDDRHMIRCVQLVKWSAAPALIVAAQMVLNARGAFQSDTALWVFCVSALIILLIWRHRLEKLTSRLAHDITMPERDDVDRADRRFAFLSMSVPFVVLIAVQLGILSLLSLDISWAQNHSGTLWTVFGITAVGFAQITMLVQYLTMINCPRWQRIIAEHRDRPPVNKTTCD